METRKGILIFPCCMLVLFMWFAVPALGDDPDGIPSVYHPLFDRLSQDGFDPEFLSKLFLDSRAEPMPDVMSIALIPGEASSLYSKFLSQESILLAKTFLQNNVSLLKKAEKLFQVEKEIIVAILLVESRFGENIGRRRVIPTLASMALMDSHENLYHNFLVLQALDPELSYEWMEGLAKRRARWAYQELKCFLKISLEEKIDPLEIRGSYAGALGMAQFVPSSYIAFAHKKSNLEDWLLSKEDAIFSIGNYLSVHGWKKNLTTQRKKQVLWSYNHSDPYIETILQIEQKLKSKASRPKVKA